MTLTLDYQVDLNGNTLGRGVSFASGAVVGWTEWTGLDTPEVDMSIVGRTNDHGAWVSGRYFKERVVTCAGRLDTTVDNYALDTFTLKQIFYATDSGVPLTVKLPGIEPMFVTVQPQGVKYAVRNTETAVGMVDFIATMTAGDPRWYSSALYTVGPITSGATVGGAVFPQAYPLAYSSGASSASQDCYNAGTFKAPTTMTLTGPLTNPRVSNGGTTKQFQLLMTIPSGQTVIVDSNARTVTYAGASRYAYLVPGSQFIDLAPGSNPISLYSDSGNGTLSVSYRNTWM